MPGLEPLLRPGWGRIGFAFFPENVAPVELSPLAPRPGFRPLLLRGPTLHVLERGKNIQEEKKKKLAS